MQRLNIVTLMIVNAPGGNGHIGYWGRSVDGAVVWYAVRWRRLVLRYLFATHP